MTKPTTTTPKELRRFALVTGGLFVILFSGIPFVRHHGVPIWPLVVAGVLILCGLAIPRTLGPVYRAWMFGGRALGYVNSRVVLSIVFFLLVTPLGLLLRMIGRDPMARTRSTRATTYRVKSLPRDIAHMEELF
jgi:ABC-type uncharacterized transport system permease subunit